MQSFSLRFNIWCCVVKLWLHINDLLQILILKEQAFRVVPYICSHILGMTFDGVDLWCKTIQIIYYNYLTALKGNDLYVFDFFNRRFRVAKKKTWQDIDFFSYSESHIQKIKHIYTVGCYTSDIVDIRFKKCWKIKFIHQYNGKYWRFPRFPLLI
jgi:hypothetical protein